MQCYYSRNYLPVYTTNFTEKISTNKLTTAVLS
jgi:hypothetical protein